jgi:hypothetical protein
VEVIVVAAVLVAEAAVAIIFIFAVFELGATVVN